MQNLQPYLILGAMALIGFVSHNNTVAWSAVLLMILKVVLPQDKLLFFGGHGLNWGVIVLTAAMLTPIATGKLGIADILNVFKTPMGIASLLMGCTVALFGRWGAELMTADPEVVASLMVGTIIGVVFFKGVPVGPLIASGILYCFMKVFHFFF